MKNGKVERILLVDGSPLNLEMLKVILSDRYVLETATNAQETYTRVNEFQPHLILLDLVLLDASGFEVLRKLKSESVTANIPVIILSDLLSDDDEERSFLLGAVDYIRKPLKGPIVRARVATQIKILEQLRAIEKMSYFDGLTGVYNRRGFDHHLKYEWGRATRERSWLSLLLYDVDRFKQYNDAYGHVQGDAMLVAVANATSASLHRSVDILCRYGGEEFAVILPNTPPEGAEVVAERIRENIEGTRVSIPTGGAITSATVSVGIASLIPGPDDSIPALIAKADAALYLGKENGRNRIHYLP